MEKKHQWIIGWVVAILCFHHNSILWGQMDWAQRVVESTMTRYTPSNLGIWGYQRGFYLFGQYRIWKSIGDNSTFQYIRDWVDLHVDGQGNIDRNIGSLDNSQPGLITLLCYVETGEEKYKLAADYIRNVYETYPRTSDGAFWHGSTMEGQLWADGVYMILPFLVHYGKVFGDTALYTEAANQIITYASHLQDTSGLLFHAYDEDALSNWADPVTHHSPWFWGRAMGWFGMAIIEILEIIPNDHTKRSVIIEILNDLIKGLSKVQDPNTGLWYQVVDKGDQSDNWLESSCSCMYSYVMARAVKNGYIDTSYKDMAIKAYAGIISEKVTIGSDGLINLKDISEGTSVSGEYDYYIKRGKNTNDLHGLGAFLMMCWQIALVGGKNSPPVVQITSPTDSSCFWPETDIPITATSYDLDGEVVQVKFYEGNNLLSIDNELPWSTTWNRVPEGSYILTAQAQDDSNDITISSPVQIFVTDSIFYFEAEEGTISAGSVDSNHPGFTGIGFVNLDNNTGTYLELTLPVPQTGIWDISFRYANGTTDSRPCEIRVDGIVVESNLDFLPTGTWEDWWYADHLSLDLEDADYLIRITGNTSVSAPNLDHLKCLYRGSGTQIDLSSRFPLKFNLEQNGPNPFNPQTHISFSIGKRSHVSLIVYNISGRIVRVVMNKELNQGRYQVIFDGSNLGSGIYFYQLKTNDFTETRKMILYK